MLPKEVSNDVQSLFKRRTDRDRAVYYYTVSTFKHFLFDPLTEDFSFPAN